MVTEYTLLKTSACFAAGQPTANSDVILGPIFLAPYGEDFMPEFGHNPALAENACVISSLPLQPCQSLMYGGCAQATHGFSGRTRNKTLTGLPNLAIRHA